jgi:glutamine synthetase
MTNTGDNLLSPGKTPKANLRFLTFLVNIIKAVDIHSGLIRSVVASAANDLRLGAHEAPPAIMSVFVGSQLSQSLDEIEKSGMHSTQSDELVEGLSLNIPKIPEIFLDNTDRNRTSPFAFTGNKFEFRAVGSSTNCAKPMIALNLALAEQLRVFRKEVDALIEKGTNKEDAIYKILQKYIKESKRIRFEGNSYGGEWIAEATSRGLENISATPEALKAITSEDVIRMFEEHDVLTRREVLARYEIDLENYIKKIQIESRIIGDLSHNHIIPTAIRYQNTLVENVKGLKEVLDMKTFVKLSNSQMQNIKEISEHISIVRQLVAEMIDMRKKAKKVENTARRAEVYNTEVLPFFEKIRYHVDKLELLVDDELWPLPKYRELLFIK